MSQNIKPTVLLIEADASLRRLLVLGLQYRGMSVIEAHSPASLPLVVIEQPGVLVLDVDGDVKSNWSLLLAIQVHPLLSKLPLIVLAWDSPHFALIPQTQLQHSTAQAELTQPTAPAQITYLTKPFDARTLYASIEQILLAQTIQITQTAPEVAPLPVVYASSPAPSMYPMITAAGLLLAFIGLMGLFFLTFVGLAIVLASLLAWTLGTGSQREHPPLAPA